MLNTHIKQDFNTVFYHFFDRKNVYNSFVSFNFLNFIKQNSEYPNIYDQSSFNSKILESLKFTFFLQNEDATTIIKIDEIKTFNLFPDKPVITFLLKSDIKKISGLFQVRCLINFEDQFRNWINTTSSKIASKYFGLSEYQYISFISDLNLINDKKFENQFKPNNYPKTYEFFSDFVNFEYKKVRVSNLFDIYGDTINFDLYREFIQKKEEEKKSVYDFTLPLTKYIKDEKAYDLIFNLEEKIGNFQNYLDLTLSLLNNSTNRYDYKETSSVENIYLKDQKELIKRETVKNYEYINSLQSTACETEIFSQVVKKDLKDSDILYVATFFENYDFLETDDFWKNNLKIIPVYIIEILTTYKIFYLKSLEENSMHETWNLLDKQSLDSLEPGKYLCMITVDKDYIVNNVVENYFILEK